MTQLNLYTICAAGMASATVLDARVRGLIARWEAAEGKTGVETRAYVPYFMQSSSTPKTEDRHFGFLDGEKKETSFDVARRTVSSASLGVARVCWAAVSSGGGWWLFPLTQGLLLDTAVFESDCFPGSYRNVIVAVSHFPPRVGVCSWLSFTIISGANGTSHPLQISGYLRDQPSPPPFQHQELSSPFYPSSHFLRSRTPPSPSRNPPAQPPSSHHISSPPNTLPSSRSCNSPVRDTRAPSVRRCIRSNRVVA